MATFTSLKYGDTMSILDLWDWVVVLEAYMERYIMLKHNGILVLLYHYRAS